MSQLRVPSCVRTTHPVPGWPFRWRRSRRSHFASAMASSIRDPAAIERLATADVLVIDHHIALERTELEVDAIHVFPGHAKEDVLRYAAAAFHDLEDERASAMNSACRARGIPPFGLHPTEIATDVTLMHGEDCIRVGDLGARARVPERPLGYGDPYRTEPESSDSLMVGINGRIAGLIHFRRSARPEAASVLRRLRIKRNLQVGILSGQPPLTLGPLAATLGADFQISGQCARRPDSLSQALPSAWLEGRVRR